MDEFQKANEVLERFADLSRKDYEFLKYLLNKRYFKRFWEIARYFKYSSRSTVTLYEYEAGVCSRHLDVFKVYVNKNSQVFGTVCVLENSGYSCRTRFLDKLHGHCQYTGKFYIDEFVCDATSLRYI